jgi:hypothetical protein
LKKWSRAPGGFLVHPVDAYFSLVHPPYCSRDLRRVRLRSSFLHPVMRDGGLRKDKTYWYLTPPTTVQLWVVVKIEDYGSQQSNGTH